MLETRATVVQRNSNTVLVLANQVSGCEQCNGQGCGSSKVAQLFCTEPKKFEVNNAIDADVGDEVIIAVADGAVLQGIGLVYLLPLLLMILGAGLSGLISPSGQSDKSVAIACILGLMLGFLITKWLSARKNNDRNKPYIARRWSDKS